jgi:PAS domain S-box-containing protein
MKKLTITDNQGKNPKKKKSILKKELVASETRYRRLFESAKDGILILDSETGKIVDVNPFLMDLLGYSKNEFIEKSIWEIGAFQDIFENKEKLLELQQNEYVRYDELPLETSDERTIHVEFVSNVYLVENHKVIQCQIRDITERKDKEDALKETHRATSEFLNILLNHLHTPIIVWDTSMIIKRFNRQFELLSGYDSAEVIDKKIDFLFPKEKIAKTLQLLKSHLNDEQDVVELDILTKDNTIKTVLWNSSRILDEEGKNIVATISQDITSRRQSEMALRKSESHLRTLIETIPDLIWLKDMNGVYLSCNPMFERFFGARETDIIGKTDYDFVERELADFFCGNDRKAMKAGKPTSNEEWVAFADDGHRAFLDTIKTPMYDFNGKLIGILGIGRDITERKLAETELVKLTRTVEQSPTSIIITDLDGNIEYANPKTLEITGYTKEELIGKNPRIFSSNEKSKSEYQQLWNTISTGNEWVGEFHNKKKNNELYWESASISPIINEKQEIINYLAIKEDITERKKFIEDLKIAKERAEESDRLKSAFLANMSHEIRTPMNGILGFTELLKTPKLTGNEQQKFIEVIEKSGARMLNIINDIIDISKIESGRVEIVISKTNINKQIENIFNLFKPEADNKKINFAFTTDLPSDKAIIETDKDKILAVLTNLVKNAMKFTQKGSIELGYEIKDKFIEFFVSDTGSGISHEQEEIIFERFRQGSESLNRNYEGAGLGLAISKAYVELLGGKIRMERNKEKGSTFRFTIPYVIGTEIKKQLVTPPEKESLNSGKLKILIVEDDKTSRMLLSIMVKSLARDLLHAISGGEAIEICRKNPDIDLVLMDINMTGMNGYEATLQIRRFNKEVLIIAQTAYALIGDREKALAAGCNDYISKPIKRETLLKMVDNNLSSKNV